MNNTRWTGTARCVLTTKHTDYANGFRGAYVVFACAADDAASCIAMLQRELAENELIIVGVESLVNDSYAESRLTEYEQMLIERLAGHPVQFENVHVFKADA